MKTVLKRTKTGVDVNSPDAPPTTRTHFAAAVDKSGIVTRWDSDRAAAAEIPDGDAEKVAARHARKGDAGGRLEVLEAGSGKVLHGVGSDKTPEAARVAAHAPEPDGGPGDVRKELAAARGRLLEQAESADRLRERLEKENADLKAENNKLKSNPPQGGHAGGEVKATHATEPHPAQVQPTGQPKAVQVEVKPTHAETKAGPADNPDKPPRSGR